MFDINGTFLKKDRNVKYLFLGILLFEFTPVILSVIISLTKKAVPFLLEAVISVLFFLSMIILLTVYMSRRTQDTGQKEPVRWINGLVTGITVYMLAGVLILCISAALKATYGFVITQPAGISMVSLAVITGCAAVVFIAGFLLYASIMLLVAAFRFKIPLSRQWSAFLILTGVVFKRFLRSVIVLVTALAFSAIVLAAVPYMAMYLERSFANAFAIVFMQALVITAAETYILYFLFNAAERGMERYYPRLAALGTGQVFYSAPTQYYQPPIQGQPLVPPVQGQSYQPPFQPPIQGQPFVPPVQGQSYQPPFQPPIQGQQFQPVPIQFPAAGQQDDAGKGVKGVKGAIGAKIGVPWFAAAVAAVLICLVIFNLPVQKDIFSELEGQVNILSGQGEMAYEMGWTDLSAVKHKKAYSMILAMEGYIKGLISQNPSSGEKLISESSNYRQDLDAAFNYDLSNVWVHIFRGYLANNSGRYGEGAASFAIALNGTQRLPDIYFGALGSYIGLKDGRKTDTMVELLIRNQFFRGGLQDTLKLEPTALYKMLKRFDDLKEKQFDYLALSAMEKMKYNDNEGMFNDIGALLQTDPDNESLLFLYGVAAMSYRPEAYNYALANSTYDRLLEVSGGEEGAAYLKGYMSLLTKDYSTAEARMKEIYEEHPDSTGFGEQYAYALFLTGKNEEALQVADKVLAADSESWFCHYVKSLIYLKTARHAESLTEIALLAEITQKDMSDGYFDEYLYAYTLAYSMHTRDQACIQALEALDSSGLLYIYIIGTTAWRDKDYTKAEEYLIKVLGMESRLAHAEYLLANVYYERSVMQKTAEFDKAEKHHLASLSMIPEHTTGWFALAHNYDKWQGHELQALRAFRKVVDLMPYSDHTRDYYGMTVHAEGNIRRLSVFEQGGG